MASGRERPEAEVAKTILKQSLNQLFRRNVAMQDLTPRMLSKAEELLPTLEFDIAKVEEIATKTIGSLISATVIGITIEPDSSALYDCTFFAGKYEDECIFINRKIDGALVVALAKNE